MRAADPGRIVYLRWGARRNRADGLSAALGGELVALRWQTRKALVVPFRYAAQFVLTLWLLCRRRPRAVISQHTQPFCSLAMLLYATLFRVPCATDCHNAPFVDRVWRTRVLDRLNRFIFRRTTVNVVHNEAIEAYARERLAMPGRFMVVRSSIPELAGEGAVPDGPPVIVVICSFSADEPVEAIVEATRLTPEFRYRITGDVTRLPPGLRARAGENVEFTGYLSNEDYDRMLLGATAAMALSTRETVLTRACHEVVGAGVPLVNSDIPVARDYLAGGTVFVQNRAPAIATGIRDAVHRNEQLRREMIGLRALRRKEWGEQVALLRAALTTRAA